MLPIVTKVEASDVSVRLDDDLPGTRGFLVVENDADAAPLRVKYGAAAGSDDYTLTLQPGDILIENEWDGYVFGIWDAAVGAARVTTVASS